MVEKKGDSRSPRLGLQLSIRVYIDDSDPVTLTTRNISNTGLFIDWDTPLDVQEGQHAHVELAECLGEGDPQKVPAKVVRIEKDGFALKYIET
jgi:hypothetical protein